MKRILLIIGLILSSIPVMAQSHLEATFTTEGIETVIGNTSGIINEPISNKIKDKFSDEDQTQQSGFNIGAEILVNENSKNISIPLKYRLWTIDFIASVPYFFNKRMEYSIKSAETSGVGDISLGAGYGRIFSETYLYGEIGVKLPTGDDEATDSDYLVPLGTGSTDVVLFGLAHRDLNDTFGLGLSLSYKINGSSSKTAEILDPDDNSKITTVDYEITNGNLFNISTYIDYSLASNLSLEGMFALKMIGEGSTDKEYSNSWNSDTKTLSDISNKQDTTLLDFSAKATYSLGIFDISGGVKLPLYTDRNDDNKEDDRGVTLFTKFDYSLF